MALIELKPENGGFELAKDGGSRAFRIPSSEVKHHEMEGKKFRIFVEEIIKEASK